MSPTPPSSSVPPARVARADVARARFKLEYETLVPALGRADDLADRVVRALEAFAPARRETLIEAAFEGSMDVPEPLRDFVAHHEGLPAFADPQRLARAGAVFRRSGVLGGITLGLCSLVHGYAAPAGNKPLALSGRLTQRAERRLAETTRFVTAVTAPRGLEAGSPGRRVTLRVRLMHSQVRRLIEQAGQWRTELWAAPINQHDMLATILLFSCVFLDGLERVGFRFSASERDDYQHLWSVVGFAMGVEPQLLPRDFAAAQRQAAFIQLTQGSPDDDSRRLVSALLEAPLARASSAQERRRARVAVRVAAGLCRSLVGDELADALGLERSWHQHGVRLVRHTLHGLEALRRRLPILDPFVELLGERYWNASLRRGLGGDPARFALPLELRGTPRSV